MQTSVPLRYPIHVLHHSVVREVQKHYVESPQREVERNQRALEVLQLEEEAELDGRFARLERRADVWLILVDGGLTCHTLESSLPQISCLPAMQDPEIDGVLAGLLTAIIWRTSVWSVMPMVRMGLRST